MPQITANGIRIEYETNGDPSHPPLLLVMGLGMQLIGWPPEFVEALVSRGYYVIRHDNRDVGHSEKFGHAGIPDFRMVVLKKLLGFSPRVPYRLTDMAGDGAELLRALKIDRAHVVGASLGGMIAQLMAIEHPDRVATLTSVMSTTGNLRLPQARREAASAMLSRPPPGATLEQNIVRGIRVARAIGSPAWPAPEARLRARFTQSYQRSFYPEGAARQLCAIIADGDRRERLRRIKAPTLVIHGLDDPLVPVEGGRDTAAHIPGARLHEIPGMGHDLPLELVETLSDLIAGHAREA
jgi:pimeloyl-ACP methyl ester carboxylesterase